MRGRLIRLHIGGGANDPIKHAVHGAVIIPVRRLTGVVVDFAADLFPVEVPTRVPGDAIPEQALGATVALAERMKVVDLFIVERQAPDEGGPGPGPAGVRLASADQRRTWP